MSAASSPRRTLKDRQRRARLAFVADGRAAYRGLRQDVFREVREEFRPEWASYYAARRRGADASLLRARRDDLVARQSVMLTERWDAAGKALREARRETYAGLLTAQRDERAGSRGLHGVDRPTISTGLRTGTDRRGEKLSNLPDVGRRSIILKPPVREQAERLAGFGMTGGTGRYKQRWGNAYRALLPQQAVPVRRPAASTPVTAEGVAFAEVEKKRQRPISSQRQAPATGARVAVSRQREAEILLRFGFRLANIELAVPREQRRAAREALLLEQAYTLAAVRALVAAEHAAATAITRKSHNQVNGIWKHLIRLRERQSQRMRRSWHRMHAFS